MIWRIWRLQGKTAADDYRSISDWSPGYLRVDLCATSVDGGTMLCWPAGLLPTGYDGGTHNAVRTCHMNS